MISSASGIGKKRPQGQLKRDMQAVSHHPPRSPAPVHPLSCLDEDLATTHPDGRQGIHRRLAIWCIGETDRRPVSLSRNCCREHPARLGRIRRTLVRSVGVNVGVRFCWRRLSIEIHCLRSEFESLRLRHSFKILISLGFFGAPCACGCVGGPGVGSCSCDSRGSWQWDAKGLGIRTMPSWQTKPSVFAVA